MDLSWMTFSVEGVEVNGLLLALGGLAIGFLVGLTGMGGGSLMTPLLILGFKFPTIVAIGTDIVYGAVTKSFGAWRHYRLGTVNTHIARWLAFGSVPSSILGVQAIEWLRHQYDTDVLDSMITAAVGTSLVLVGVMIMGRLVWVDEHVHPMYDGTTQPLAGNHRRTAFITGVLSGFVLGMTSVGSGTFIGLALVLFFPLSARRIVGTDVFHAAILLWAAGAAHFTIGNVYLPAVLTLLAGSIPGVILGSQATAKIADKPLKSMLATVLMASGVKVVGAPVWAMVLTLGIGALFVAGISYRSYLHRADPPLPLPEAPYDDLGVRALAEVTFPLPDWYADEDDDADHDYAPPDSANRPRPDPRPDFDE